MFLQACLSKGGRGVCLSACWDTPLQQTPQEQTPQTRHPPEQAPPWEQTSPEQTHTPQTRHPPGSRLQHTVNEQPVRILLECILVTPVCHSVHGGGDMRGCGGHAWLRGVCVVAGGKCGCGGGMCGIRRDTVDERAVRILLECILLVVSNAMQN